MVIQSAMTLDPSRADSVKSEDMQNEAIEVGEQALAQGISATNSIFSARGYGQIQH
jgi:hypothetical protein